jgi:8-oxo-dGTP pyrophosphatase MutT (NUDIX family)
VRVVSEEQRRHGADWPPHCRPRATAFLTDRSGRLLVFDHVPKADAGTQVPGGGFENEESARAAVLRELAEESGVSGAEVVRQLGEAWVRAASGEEQVTYAFHLRVTTEDVPSAWEWDECSGGSTPLFRFAFRWISLDEARRVLWPSQAMWITPLEMSLAARGVDV